MSGELAAFIVFIGLMLAMCAWMVRRSHRHLDAQERLDIEELKKAPP